MRYVSFSGGADSTALAILLHERGQEIELVFADTGAELPETYWIIPRVARLLGVPLHIVSNGTFFQHLAEPQGQLKRLPWCIPGHHVRWCTKELKVKVLPKQIAVGIRADEKDRMPDFDRPLVDAGLGKRDVLNLCASRGLLNPIYEWRSNCSCFCCPFQRKHDWLNMLDRHPDLYALAEDWEENAKLMGCHTRITWNAGYSLRQLREADEAQMALMPECREEACAICQW